MTIRQKKPKPLFDELETWLGAQLPKISGKSELAMAIRYAITRMKKMRSYLDHGALELDNNSAERSVRCVALGRKNYLFMGSESGGKSAAIAYTLIETAKLNGVDPQVWLTDLRPYRRSQDHPDRRAAPLVLRCWNSVTDLRGQPPERVHRTLTLQLDEPIESTTAK